MSPLPRPVRYVLDGRLLEPAAPGPPAYAYAHTVFVFDDEEAVVRSADVFRSRWGALPGPIHAGADRNDPRIEVSDRIPARVRIGAQWSLRAPNDGPQLGWLARTGRGFRVHRADESVGAVLRNARRGWRAWLSRPSFVLDVEGRASGTLRIEAVPTAQQKRAKVRRWVLTTDLAERDPPLFDLVLAAAIVLTGGSVAGGIHVPVRTAGVDPASPAPT